MQQISIKQGIEAAKKRALEIIQRGGGEMVLHGQSYATGTIRRHVGILAAKHSFYVYVVKADDNSLHIKLQPGGEIKTRVVGGPRGRRKSDARLDVEALKPGQTAWIDLTDSDVYRARGVVSQVKKATERAFTTELDKENNTLTVTRIDSLHEAPDDLREFVVERLEARNRWPFGRLAIGEESLVPGAENIDTARSLAQYHKRKYSKAFSVQMDGQNIKITRLS